MTDPDICVDAFHDEVWENICVFLPNTSLGLVPQVSRRLRDLFSSRSTWRHLFASEKPSLTNYGGIDDADFDAGYDRSELAGAVSKHEFKLASQSDTTASYVLVAQLLSLNFGMTLQELQRVEAVVRQQKAASPSMPVIDPEFPTKFMTRFRRVLDVEKHNNGDDIVVFDPIAAIMLKCDKQYVAELRGTRSRRDRDESGQDGGDGDDSAGKDMCKDEVHITVLDTLLPKEDRCTAVQTLAVVDIIQTGTAAAPTVSPLSSRPLIIEQSRVAQGLAAHLRLLTGEHPTLVTLGPEEKTVVMALLSNSLSLVAVGAIDRVSNDTLTVLTKAISDDSLLLCLKGCVLHARSLQGYRLDGATNTERVACNNDDVLAAHAAHVIDVQLLCAETLCGSTYGSICFHGIARRSAEPPNQKVELALQYVEDALRACRGLTAAESVEGGGSPDDALLSSTSAMSHEMQSRFATGLHLRAHILWNLGRGREGTRDAQLAADIRSTLFGIRHHLVADSLNKLGVCLHDSGQMDAGCEVLKECVQMFREHHSEVTVVSYTNHIRVVSGDRRIARSLNDLARLLSETEKHEEAQALNEECLGRRVELLGEMHFEVSQSLLNLGAQNFNLGRMDVARRFFMQALLIRTNTIGPTHELTQNAQAFLMSAMYQMGVPSQTGN